LVDGTKANMSRINYFFALVEVIDPAAAVAADTVSVVYSQGGADIVFGTLVRDLAKKTPAWIEFATPGGINQAFTGAQTLFFDASAFDTNMRLHLLMGCKL